MTNFGETPIGPAVTICHSQFVSEAPNNGFGSITLSHEEYNAIDFVHLLLP